MIRYLSSILTDVLFCCACHESEREIKTMCQEGEKSIFFSYRHPFCLWRNDHQKCKFSRGRSAIRTVKYFNSVPESWLDEMDQDARGGIRKRKRRVIYLTDYEKSFPIASGRRHRKPISSTAAFGVCAIRPPRPRLSTSLPWPGMGARDGSESAERSPSKCHLSLHRFPGSSFSFKEGVFLIAPVDCRSRSRFLLSSLLSRIKRYSWKISLLSRELVDQG
jgi:hypothetical protein